MKLLFIIGCIVAYKAWKYCQKNKSVGILDWEKLKYYKYYKQLPKEEIQRLMNAGFFTDQEATRKFKERNGKR